jgi:arsenate reductase (thioredoxin)
MNQAAVAVNRHESGASRRRMSGYAASVSSFTVSSPDRDESVTHVSDSRLDSYPVGIELDPITRGHIERGVEGLVDEFRGIFSRETIDRYVQESLQRLPAARFRDFVPLLVHRFARERLRALGQAEGTIAKDVPEVLFVCVQNSGRSQMAAGLLHQRAAGLVHVRSAGSAPAEQINASVVKAMEEVGVDLAQEFPKPLTDEVVRAADVVITMGCGDACPIYPGRRYLDWDLDDPVDRPIADVREIRDDIDRRVRDLLATL